MRIPALCVLVLFEAAIAGGDLGDKTWDRLHEVPKGVRWQISWVSPYEPFAIRGPYDLSIVRYKRGFEVESHKVTDIGYNRTNCGVCISALSKSEPTVVVLPEGTQFKVFNDIIEFKILEQ